MMFVNYSIVLCSVLSVFAKDNINGDQNAGEAQKHNGFVLLRFKREPQMNRAMTFTGFMPGGGMTAFSAAADPFQRMMPQWYSPEKPAETLSPPAEADGTAEQEEPKWMKKPKKKPYYPSKHFPTTSEEDEEEYETPSKRRGSGGSAKASFNAWFPIMLGGYPNQYGRSSNGDGNNYDGGDNRPNNGNGNNDPYYSGRSQQYPGQTVIANSVSNGKGGVASSHAVAYGNSAPEGRNNNYRDDSKMKNYGY